LLIWLSSIGQLSRCGAVFLVLAHNDEEFDWGALKLLRADRIVEAHTRLRDLPSSTGRRPGTTMSGVILTEHEDLPCWIVLNVGDQFSDLEGGYALHPTKLPNPMYYLP